MRTLSIWTTAVSLLLCCPSTAAVRPAFSLDYSAFHATDIVMVRTTSDGAIFEVVEAWKGNLPAGEHLVIPELRPDPNAAPISAYTQSSPQGVDREALPNQPPGSSMILFLRNTQSSASSRSKWLPSDLMNSMKASAVWIDGNHIYCFEQTFNPGPSILNTSARSTLYLHDRVSQIAGIQRELRDVLAMQDARQRAEALKQYAYSSIFPVQQFALEQLGNSGSAAVPTILGLVDDPTVPCDASELVAMLVKAGGLSVGLLLSDRLSQELTFWKSTAPSLHQGWWNSDPSIHAPLRQHYGKTIQLIVGIREIGYTPAIGTVGQVRDYWRSQPQLNDSTGLDQMVEECNRTIRHLSGN